MPSDVEMSVSDQSGNKSDTLCAHKPRAGLGKPSKACNTRARVTGKLLGHTRTHFANVSHCGLGRGARDWWRSMAVSRFDSGEGPETLERPSQDAAALVHRKAARSILFEDRVERMWRSMSTFAHLSWPGDYGKKLMDVGNYYCSTIYKLFFRD